MIGKWQIDRRKAKNKPASIAPLQKLTYSVIYNIQKAQQLARTTKIYNKYHPYNLIYLDSAMVANRISKNL